jgi:hypothetical protein
MENNEMSPIAQTYKRDLEDVTDEDRAMLERVRGSAVAGLSLVALVELDASSTPARRALGFRLGMVLFDAFAHHLEEVRAVHLALPRAQALMVASAWLGMNESRFERAKDHLREVEQAEDVEAFDAALDALFCACLLAFKQCSHVVLDLGLRRVLASVKPR